MNVIKLIGGLGNQLFQYAFGRAMVMEDIEVAYDTRWYIPHRIPARPYVLDKFNTSVKFSHLLPKQKMVREGRYFTVNLRDGLNFHGYWQNPIYHEKALPLLKKEFSVKEEFYTKEFLELKEKISTTNSVSLHVRRGDFFFCDFYTMEADYYHKAIEVIKILNHVDKIYVFSDDMEWCRENFKDVEFVSTMNYLDFELMKSCKHNIIQGNSSFSLWAAYLNDNANKTVIIPSQSRLREKDLGIYSKRGISKEWVRV